MGGVAATNGGSNDFLQMLMMGAQGATDDASSMSKSIRDAIEAMNQMAMELMNMLGGIAQVLMQVFGTISG